MEEDLQLVDRYDAGDGEAIEELVRKYQRPIYAFAYRMTHDIEEAKDITQKTFFNMAQGMKGFGKRSSLKTWLYRIAANISINHIRERSGRQEVELEEALPSGQTGALTMLIEGERRDHVRHGLSGLPERQRLAVMLRVYDGLSCRETAKVMGCSEGAVKAHYHHGIRRLREIVKERGHEIRA
ncbi:MAG: RNA polymerase sigma factor [Thermodesulfovibrionales bacterium]